jgi:membrane associated rhomboid family serine protease
VAIILLAVVSACLLLVNPSYTAIHFSEFPTLKFFLNFFTYQIDHANLQHLLGNFTFMAPYGIYLERKIGVKNFLAFFFVTGIMAAVVFWVSNPNAYGLVGSSGSAFGVFTAACLAFNRKPWQCWAGFFWIGIILGVQLFYAFNPGIFNNTAYWGHLGGAAAGAVLAFYFVPRGGASKRSERGRRRRRG